MFGKFIAAQSKRYLGFKECMRLFTEVANLNLSLEQAKLAYGMSKMTVVNAEKLDDQKGCMHMEFVEFLEMVCRVAVTNFKNTESANVLSLLQKIEVVLGELLIVVGQSPNPVKVEEAEISESDQDY